MNDRTSPTLSGRHFLRYHFPLILYAGLVIGLSSIPDLQGPRLRIIALDKIAHFVEYALFAVLAWRSFSHLSARLSVNASVLLSMLFLVVFALTDEYFQSFIPGRHADLADLAVDILGSFLVLTLLWIRARRPGPARKLERP